MANIDLDAARAARREAAGEAPVIIFGGERFTLPVEMPFEVAEHFSAAGTVSPDAGAEAAAPIIAALKVLLDDQYEAFMRHRPSMQDLVALFEGAMAAYGFGNAGESSASAAS